MISDEIKEKVEKLPKWAQQLINDLDRDGDRYKEQLESMGGVERSLVEGKESFLDDMISDVVVPFESFTNVVFQVGPERYQRFKIRIKEAEHGEPGHLIVYAHDKVSIEPSSSNSLRLVPKD